ncbi:MAG: serine/threonine-protein kinase, partial [Acidobacteria bacterium]|nr:serine/threonine-protein kinase [Acidobacteriota bacterium]
MRAGEKLGRYELLAPIGAGGMGEVWQARDTRLDRTVAIKHSAQRFSDRFEREAHAIAALNHPHICTLYDVGPDYLVMEFVEGKPLRGPLPLQQALELGAQIADALRCAHSKGIVHRDLKPGNVLLTKSGVKLLDFGLAKIQAQTAATDTTVTTAQPLTEGNAILGTLQYMSPEQLEGKPADARSDIFALGLMLYELVCGKPAFHAQSQASLIAAILKAEPAPLGSLQPVTPPALDRVVRKCLDKDPDRRWQSAADLRDELLWVAQSGAAAPLGESHGKPSRRVMVWAVIVLVVLTAAGYVTADLIRTPPSQPAVRAVITLPPEAPLAVGSPRPAIALSPDGTQLVYVADRAGKTQLYLRHLDRSEPAPMAGTEGASGPFWAPDGQSVSYFDPHLRLKKISAQGGAPVTLSEMTPVSRGGTWGPDNIIVVATDPNGGLFRISGAGSGEANRVPTTDRSPTERRMELWHPWFRSGRLTTPDEKTGEGGHGWPEFLPGGKSILFTLDIGAGLENGRIAALSLATKQWKTLVEGGSTPRYSPGGHLVFARSGTLLAAAFDAGSLALTGPPVPVVENVWTENTGAAHFSVSQNGTLVYATGNVAATTEAVVWVDRNGNAQQLLEGRYGYFNPALSPDDRRLAISIAERSNSDLWVTDVARRAPARLTFHPEEDVSPVWSPDGKRIAFASEMSGPGPVLAWVPANAGSAAEQLIKPAEYWQFPSSWSPDGRLLAYTECLHPPRNGMDIWILPLDGDRKPRLFLGTEFDESEAMFSPDGRWIAYVSDESGQPEVYVRPYPGPGGKWKVSSGGGTEPDWTRSGRELVYRNGYRMMAVAVRAGPQFDAGQPYVLFEGPYEQVWPPGRTYAVTRDGERF